MLSIAKLAGNLDYYLELATVEYYLRGGEPPGVWYGQGAEQLGLSGQVDPEQLKQLAQGFHPDGRKLVQNAGKENRQIGWDLTFSAPKSVSVMWAVSSPDVRRMTQQCQRLAVQKTLSFLEEVAGQSRIGKAGLSTESAGLVMGLFEHGTSRANDPQLHTHALVLNVGVGEDGKTRTIQSKPFFDLKMTAGALYRAELGHQLVENLGVRLVRDRFGFKIKGIPDVICDEFSKRRKEVEQALRKAGQTSAKAAQIATLETRKKKDVAPRAELFETWQRDCRGMGLTPSHVLSLTHRRKRRTKAPWAVMSAFRGLAGQHSYFSHHEILGEAAVRAQDRGVSIEQLRKTTQKYLKESPQAVKLQEQLYTSAKNLETEDRLLALAEQMSTVNDHQVPVKRLEKYLLRNAEQRQSLFRTNKPGHVLTWEQSAALAHMTINEGAIQFVAGKAGVGKTEMLKMAREIWEESGFKVYGATIGGKAARGLQNATGIRTFTVAKVLYDARHPSASPFQHHLRQLWRATRKRKTWRHQPSFKLNRKSVLVLDEAAMIGTQDLYALLQEADQAGAKVILTGDPYQLPPIPAGIPFRSLMERLGHVQIDEIKRQRDAFDRKVVEDLSNGQMQFAMENLHDRGLVHLAESREEAIDRLIQDWAEAKGRNDPIFVPTRAEAAAINRKCQQIRRQNNEIGRWKWFTIDEQKFYVGDRILFQEGDKRIGVANGDFATITGINESRKLISAQLDDGKRLLIPLKRFHNFSLGYATTVHKGQGMTVENAYVLLGGRMQDRHLSYVQMSRAAGLTRVYVDRHEAGPGFERIITRMKRSDQRELVRDRELRREQLEQKQQQQRLSLQR